MRQLSSLIALGLLSSGAAALSAQTPHLSGTVDIDLEHGGVTGDLCVSRLPSLPRYQFLLNRGLNIKRFRDSSSRMLRFAIVHAAGTSAPDFVVFAEPNDMVILGSRSLEGMNLRVDAQKKQLVPAGPILAVAGVA